MQQQKKVKSISEDAKQRTEVLTEKRGYVILGYERG